MLTRIYQLLGLGLALGIILWPTSAVGLSASGVLIVEVQTTGSTDAGQEFVRLFNSSELDVDLTGWKLQYKSASGSSWTNKSTLSGVIGPGASKTVGTSSFTDFATDFSMNAGLARGGGHVQLLDAGSVVQDLVGWGTAVTAEGLATPAPVQDQSLIRRQLSSTYIDTDNNLNDFELEIMPVVPDPEPTPEPSPEKTSSTAKSTPDANKGLLPLQITELFPNPADPQSDSEDEFVELYNPNNAVFVLKGYKLQTGLTFSYNLTFSDQQVLPHSYLTITSGTSSLTLSNSGGAARLLDPSGVTISQSEAYDKATEANAWALIDGQWQWTTTPTPGVDNVLSEVLGEKSEENSSTDSKSSDSKSSKSAASSKGNFVDKGKSSPRIHTVIIALIGLLGLGYAIYEYRHDIGNLVYKLRRNREYRRRHWWPFKGRGSYRINQ